MTIINPFIISIYKYFFRLYLFLNIFSSNFNGLLINYKSTIYN